MNSPIQPNSFRAFVPVLAMVCLSFQDSYLHPVSLSTKNKLIGLVKNLQRNFASHMGPFYAKRIIEGTYLNDYNRSCKLDLNLKEIMQEGCNIALHFSSDSSARPSIIFELYKFNSNESSILVFETMIQKIKEFRTSRRTDFCILDDNQIVNDVYRRDEYVLVLGVDNFFTQVDKKELKKILQFIDKSF